MKKTKGFTLTELTVAMLILILLIGLAMSVLFSGQNILFRQSDTVMCRKAGDAMCDFIADKLIYANAIDIASVNEGHIKSFDNDGLNEVIFFVDGRMYFGEMENGSPSASGSKLTYLTDDTLADYDIYGEEFYCGYMVFPELYYHDDCLVDITVTLKESSNGDPVYQRTVTIAPVNAFDGESGGSFSMPSGENPASTLNGSSNKNMFIGIKI